MRANRNFLTVALLASIGCASLAQVPAVNAMAGASQPGVQGVQQTPASAAAAPSQATPASAPSLARPSDTIGEAADRQRMQRMLATQVKPVGPVSGPSGTQPGVGSPIVGGISVERAPVGLTSSSKPQQAEMLLAEILRGPKATLVVIEVSGVERRVAEGDDLGNGWRVKKVGRFTVDLEEFTVEAVDQSGGAKQKGKAKARGVKKAPKTQTLALKSLAAGGSEMQRSPIAR